MPVEVERVHQSLAERIAERAAASKLTHDCLIVGLCGPQGSGKSTMVPILKGLIEKHGLAVTSLALDDFYLPKLARERLAQDVHPLLKTRGVPGTHDIGLLLLVLGALRTEGTVAVPVFDKATDDRQPRNKWLQVEAPVQVIILEGWCVGAVAQRAELLGQAINALERDADPDGSWRRYVNDMLEGAYQELFSKIDLQILLVAPSFDVVHRWRVEQENDLRARVIAQSGDISVLMGDHELRRFISHFERLTGHIQTEMPYRADILVRLDEKRRPTIDYEPRTGPEDHC